MNLKDQPQSLIDSAKALLDDIRESKPLDETITQWIKDNRQDYYYKYGIEEGERLLDAKSWVLRKEAIKSGHKALENLIESFDKDDEDNRLKSLHKATTSQAGLPELGEGMTADEKNNPANKKTVEEEKIASSEPSSALGFKDKPEGDEYDHPKHVDVIHDTTIIGGVKTDGYRLFLQYPNASRIWPTSEFPSAPSIESLLALSSGIPDKYNQIQKALSAALDYPSDKPEWTGNDKK